MKIIHTSDWHLGNRLMDRSRKDEQEKFLKWLLALMEEEKPDALVVSGDIFDTGTPGEATREMYSNFLTRADGTGCNCIIMTAGNHDSVSQLESTRPFLSRFHCKMVTQIKGDDVKDGLIEVPGKDGEAVGLVCAMPYLRPSDVSIPTDEVDSRGNSLSYYRGVELVIEKMGEAAKQWKEEHQGKPVVAMAHLPVEGVEATPSTRRLLGTVETVGRTIFPTVFDYVALGHIHKASGEDAGRVLYSGSPLAMGVDEAQYEHYVFVVDVGDSLTVQRKEVPKFTRFLDRKCEKRIDLDYQFERLGQEILESKYPIWLTLRYYGGDLTSNELNNMVREKLPRENVPHFIAIRSLATQDQNYTSTNAGDSLEHYTPESLFERLLNEYAIEHPDIKGVEDTLKSLFNEVESEVEVQIEK